MPRACRNQDQVEDSMRTGRTFPFRRTPLSVAIGTALALSAATGADAQTLDVTMSYSPAVIAPGGASTMTIRVINNSSTARTDLQAYAEGYPAQITNTGPPVVTAGPCVATGTAGNSFFNFDMVSGTVPAFGYCEFQVPVTASA